MEEEEQDCTLGYECLHVPARSFSHSSQSIVCLAGRAHTCGASGEIISLVVVKSARAAGQDWPF